MPQGRADEDRLTEDIVELADQCGRYGYRMVTGLLNNAGWHVNPKRVERIWRREGLKVPQKQKKKGRLWLKDGSCVLPENYYLPGDLERQIGAFVEYYNNERYHESLNNVTPSDVYFGRDKAIIREREKIKKLTIQSRRLQYQKQAA